MNAMLKTALCALLCSGLLTGCMLSPLPEQTEPSSVVSAQPTAESAEPTQTVTEPTEPQTQPSTEPPTEPEHSALYIPGLDAEDVITYFNEVCLDAEFVNGGNATLLQKWDEPIVCYLSGSRTEEDYATMTAFISWLNTIEGFPGIRLTEQEFEANLHIYFCSQQKMVEILGDNFWGMDGGVTFWYDGSNRIYRANICYRDDLEQQLRNSVILEEIYNGLGPVQDTQLRPDSIIYADFSQPQVLTEVDELILKLLYHPDMVCGMNAAQCEAVIRQLYY